MKLIVGLGNPGKEYADTRHNAGFWVVDKLAKDCDAEWTADKARESKTAKCHLGRSVLVLAKPQTFMNQSGRAVALLAGFYKIQPQDILIVQDEMDFAPGALGLTLGGSAAGHNGYADILLHFKNIAVNRLRVGIGKPQRASERKDWVLNRPSKEDETAIAHAVSLASQAATDWAKEGMETAMNKWNQYKKLAAED